MAIVMAIVFTSQSSFNKTLVLANTAYDIALTLRSAETRGLGSRVTTSASNAGYGVHFQTGTPGTFTLFSDTFPMVGSNPSSLCHTPPANDPVGPNALPGNCVYESASGERVTDYMLGNGITIGDFCALSGSWSCTYAHDGYSGGLSSLDIVFARPNAEPFISVNGLYTPSSPVTRACLTVTSPQGGARFISVAQSGEITANAPSCP